MFKLYPSWQYFRSQLLRTPGRRPTRIALQARAVSHQREIPARAAGFALIAFRLRLGPFLSRRGAGVAVRPLHLLERLRRREFLLGLGLERRSAGEFGARGRGGECGDVG